MHVLQKKSCWTPSFLLVFFSRTVGASWRLAKKNSGNVPRWDLKIIWWIWLYKSWAPKKPGRPNKWARPVLFDGSENPAVSTERMWGVSLNGGFPQQRIIGFPTKKYDRFGVFRGYHHFRKHPCIKPLYYEYWDIYYIQLVHDFFPSTVGLWPQSSM